MQDERAGKQARINDVCLVISGVCRLLDVKPRWVLQKEQGSTRLELEGTFVSEDADRIAEVLRMACDDGARIEVDVSRCKGSGDAFIVRLLERMRQGAPLPGLAFVGLTRHQLRLMDYLGFAEAPAPHGG